MTTYSFDSGYNLSNNPFNNNSGYSTTQLNSLDELTKQFYSNLNNDFASTLPKFNYDPKTGDEDVTAKNDRSRQQGREDLAYNQDLTERDAVFKRQLNSGIDLESRNRNWSDAMAKASIDRDKMLYEAELKRPRTQTTSITYTTPAQYQQWMQQQRQLEMNKADADNVRKQGEAQAELMKQSALIPMQTQATVQTQAPQFASAQRVADIQAEASKAVAEATARANMYGANLNAMSNMFGSQMGAVGNMFGGMNTGGNARYW
ncbi:MAG TPA: hypothetical protein V6C58_01255 [Allocoleopsis sp.]